MSVPPTAVPVETLRDIADVIGDRTFVARACIAKARACLRAARRRRAVEFATHPIPPVHPITRPIHDERKDP